MVFQEKDTEIMIKSVDTAGKWTHLRVPWLRLIKLTRLHSVRIVYN